MFDFFVLVVSILRMKFSTNLSLWWTSLNCEVNDIGASYHLIYVIILFIPLFSYSFSTESVNGDWIRMESK